MMSRLSPPKIHITLEEDVHRRLRVQVALHNTTIQDYVEALVTKAVRAVKLPEDK
jgi:plasmid stability protein